MPEYYIYFGLLLQGQIFGILIHAFEEVMFVNLRITQHAFWFSHLSK